VTVLWRWLTTDLWGRSRLAWLLCAVAAVAGVLWVRSWVGAVPGVGTLLALWRRPGVPADRVPATPPAQEAAGAHQGVLSADRALAQAQAEAASVARTAQADGQAGAHAAETDPLAAVVARVEGRAKS
jgi:hypothetical protein